MSKEQTNEFKKVMDELYISNVVAANLLNVSPRTIEYMRSTTYPSRVSTAAVNNKTCALVELYIPHILEVNRIADNYLVKNGRFKA